MNNATKITIGIIAIIAIIALIWIVSVFVNDKAIVNNERVDIPVEVEEPLIEEEQIKPVNDIITITAQELHGKLMWAHTTRDHNKIRSYENKTMIITKIEVRSVKDYFRGKFVDKPVRIYGQPKDVRAEDWFRTHIYICPDNPAHKKVIEEALVLERGDIISIKTSMRRFTRTIPGARIILGGKGTNVQILSIERKNSY